MHQMAAFTFFTSQVDGLFVEGYWFSGTVKP